MKNLALAYDQLALKCYYRNEFRHAYTYGKKAFELDPTNERLSENLQWYSAKYSPKPTNSRAWITLLSDNSFINGVVVLHRSLKETGTKYPLYAAVTEEVSEENLLVLEKLNIPTIHFDLVVPPNMSAAEAPEVVTTLDEYGWHKALCKLRVFGLEQFDKLVFIDADMIVKNNMDEIFELPHLSACRDCYDFEGQFGTTPSLNSGLLVIEPDPAVVNNILSFLANFDSQGKLVHDQWIIQEYYEGWEACTDLHLPYYYCPWTTRFDFDSPQYYYHRHLIKAIHMIDVKPWRVNRQYFFDLMDSYYLYAILSLDYIDILNYTIRDLARQGISSSNLKLIS